MTKKGKLKRQKISSLRMIAAGMIHLAITFAAATPAAVRWCRWFSEIGNPQRVKELTRVRVRGKGGET